jgi:hypothetical protein
VFCDAGIAGGDLGRCVEVGRRLEEILFDEREREGAAARQALTR